MSFQFVCLFATLLVFLSRRAHAWQPERIAEVLFFSLLLSRAFDVTFVHIRLASRGA